MAEGRTHIGELFAKRESTYAQTETGTAKYLRLVEGSFKPALKIDGESLRDERIVPTAFDEEEPVLGSQYGGKCSFQVYGEGLASPMVEGASYSSPTNSLAILIRAMFGASMGAEGSLVEAAGTTTSAVEHSAGDAAFFDEGSVIGVVTNSGPGDTAAVECAVVRKKTGNVMALWTTLASVPAAGSPIYNSETFYVSPSAYGGDGESLYLEWVGENAEDQYKMRGVCPTKMTMDFTMRQLMKFTFDCDVNQATRPNSGSITRTAPVGGHPIPMVNRTLYFGTNADADAVIARTVLEIEDMALDTGIETADEGGGGQQTLYRRRIRRCQPKMTLNYRITRSSSQWAAFHTERAASTKKYAHVQCGNSVASSGRGGIFFAAMPRCNYDAPIGREDADGFVRGNIMLGGTRPRSYTGGVQAVMDSAIICAVL